MTPQEKFIKFLEENKALEKFKKNLGKDKEYGNWILDDYLKKY